VAGMWCCVCIGAVSDVMDVDRCHINKLRTMASSSFVRPSSALVFRPTHLKLPSPLSPASSLQARFRFSVNDGGHFMA